MRFITLFLYLAGVSRREGSIDDAEPTTKEQFAELRNNLVKKMQSLSLKENYNDFVEELIRDICVGCELYFKRLRFKKY